MLEVYRHGGASRHGAYGAGHSNHHSSAIQPHRQFSGFGGIGDWTDVLLPRSASSPASSAFNVWELSPNKLRTAAVAFTFVITAGYISMLAAGGLLAILVTGAVVTCCVLLTVLTCATLITLIVTGVPVGYAILRMFLAARKPSAGGGGGGGFGGGGAAPGLFSGLFGGGGGGGGGPAHPEDHHRDRPATGGFGTRPHGGSGWHYHAEDDGDADEE